MRWLDGNTDSMDVSLSVSVGSIFGIVHLICEIMAIELFKIFFYYTFNVLGISSDFSFISNIGNYILFFSWLAWLEVCQIYFF